MWKIGNFTATLILREINFGSFQKVKNCRFNNFGGFEFGFMEKTLEMSKVPKNSKVRAAQVVEMAVFLASK